MDLQKHGSSEEPVAESTAQTVPDHTHDIDASIVVISEEQAIKIRNALETIGLGALSGMYNLAHPPVQPED